MWCCRVACVELALPKRAARFGCFGACLSVAALYAHILTGLLQTPRIPTPLPSTPVRMSVVALAVADTPAKGLTPAARLPIETRPKDRTRLKTGQTLGHKAPTPSHTSTPTANPLQEAAVAVPAPRAAFIPPAVPPAHGEDIQGRVYPETPGGDTLVLALLVNADGEVLSVKVMVPSGHPLQDVNYPLWLVGRKFAPPRPPLAPGETRWVDLRIRYSTQAAELP